MRRRGVQGVFTGVIVAMVAQLGAVGGVGAASAAAPSVTTVAQSLNQGGAAAVRAVSCAHVVCAAVGDATSLSGPAAPFVTVRTNNVWHDTPVPNVNGVGVAVSCSTDTFCVAVGTSSQSGNAPVWVATWNGTTWSFASPALGLGSAPSVTVSSLSCASANLCAFGGSYADSAGLFQAFVVVWNGSSWTSQVVAQSLNGGGDAATVALHCNPSSCVAAGYATNQQLAQQGFVTQVQGGSSVTVPVATDISQATASTVIALDCSSATRCEIGGSYVDTSGNQQAFVGRFDGQNVVDQTVAATKNTGGYADVSTVSCPSASTCVAVGTFETKDGTASGFAALLSAGSPVVTTITGGLVASITTQVSAMTCASGASCLAVGMVVDANGKQRPFMSSFDGTTWSAQEVFSANNTSGFGAATGVSCLASGCLLAGFASDAANHQQALIGSLPYQAQSALGVNGATTAVAGSSVAVTVSGGSGTATPSLSVSGPGCSLTVRTVVSTSAGVCVVTATNVGTGLYATATATLTITFSPKNQAAFQLFVPATTLRIGKSMTISPRGGSGAGAVSYVLVGRSCALRGSVLTAKAVGVCTIAATKAASGLYGAATSSPIRVTVGK